MGTHPIFESDFDCLTDMVTVEFLDEAKGIVTEILTPLSDKPPPRTAKQIITETGFCGRYRHWLYFSKSRQNGNFHSWWRNYLHFIIGSIGLRESGLEKSAERLQPAERAPASTRHLQIPRQTASQR